MNDQKKRREESLESLGKTMDNADSTVGGQSFSITAKPGDEQDASHRLIEVGDRIGKYEIKGKLGQGGMAAVYLGFDPMIEREVAIKVLPPEVSQQPKALERFLSEARATGKLNHPNVVSIFDIAKEGDSYYIVMEVVPGGSVGDFIERREEIDWKKACQIAIEACDGLAAAHEAGLIHRDIKPDNLMMTDDGAVKVVDFGLAKLVDAASESRMAITGEGQFVGTPHYMSPEQFDAMDLDSRSDVYAMGGTFFTLLTGEPPFSNAKNLISLMTAHSIKPPPDPSESNDEIPTACGQIIAKAMSKKPDDRYRDAGELAAALRDLVSDDVETENGSVTPDDRPLKSVLVVEPSKMQAMMFSRGLQSSGVRRVEVCGSVAESLARLSDQEFDAVITAMQLPDESGIDLLAHVRKNAGNSETMVVVNASEPSTQLFTEIHDVEPCAVVSKKANPTELLRSVSAATHLKVEDDVDPLDVTKLHVLMICDSPRIPDVVADLVREALLMNLQVKTQGDTSADPIQADFVMVLRTAGDAVNDTELYIDLLNSPGASAPVTASIQIDGDRITLRALSRCDFTGVFKCPVDGDRLRELLRLTR